MMDHLKHLAEAAPVHDAMRHSRTESRASQVVARAISSFAMNITAAVPAAYLP